MTISALMVVGSGRTGTHFLLRTLRGFSNVHDPLHGNETSEILSQTASAALFHRPIPPEVRSYHESAFASRPDGKILSDQHHPNLFFMPELAAVIDNPIWLFPARPVWQTVASMLNHRGVMNWYSTARRATRPHRRGVMKWYSNAKRATRPEGLRAELPLPNQFLGIDSWSQLKKLPLHKLCALRVASHHAVAKKMIKQGFDLREVDYERLVLDGETELQRVFSPKEIDQLGTFTLREKPNPGALTRHETTLSSKQVAEVKSTFHEFNSENV